MVLNHHVKKLANHSRPVVNRCFFRYAPSLCKIWANVTNIHRTLKPLESVAKSFIIFTIDMIPIRTTITSYPIKKSWRLKFSVTFDRKGQNAISHSNFYRKIRPRRLMVLEVLIVHSDELGRVNLEFHVNF